MNAKFIADVLAKKHRDDLFLTEVKNGPTYNSSNLLRMDAWAMKLTWKNQIFGYEIKVSRSDFLSDTKWPQYMDYCNQFSWVCPEGLIKRNEVDERVGLIYVKEDGSLKVIKRALYRDVTIPSSLYKYVLMWKIADKTRVKTKEDLIEEYLSGKERRVELAKKFNNKITTENKKLKNELDSLNRKIELWKPVMEEYSPFTVHRIIEESKKESSQVDRKLLSFLEDLNRRTDAEIRRIRQNL